MERWAYGVMDNDYDHQIQALIYKGINLKDEELFNPTDDGDIAYEIYMSNREQLKKQSLNDFKQLLTVSIDDIKEDNLFWQVVGHLHLYYQLTLSPELINVVGLACDNDELSNSKTAISDLRKESMQEFKNAIIISDAEGTEISDLMYCDDENKRILFI